MRVTRNDELFSWHEPAALCFCWARRAAQTIWPRQISRLAHFMLMLCRRPAAAVGGLCALPPARVCLCVRVCRRPAPCLCEPGRDEMMIIGWGLELNYGRRQRRRVELQLNINLSCRRGHINKLRPRRSQDGA